MTIDILLHILRMHGPITYNKHEAPIDHVLEIMYQSVH